ncbi:unnamed protein product [Absidia cylindrospora]
MSASTIPCCHCGITFNNTRRLGNHQFESSPIASGSISAKIPRATPTANHTGTNETQCVQCGSQHYKEDDIPVRKLKTQLGLFMYYGKTRQLLFNKNSTQPYNDILDGEAFKKGIQSYRHNQNDIFISLYCTLMDFPLPTRPTLVHVVVLNLPALIRNKDAMMLQYTLFPGPKQDEFIDVFASSDG